jgi:BRCA2 repeat
VSSLKKPRAALGNYKNGINFLCRSIFKCLAGLDDVPYKFTCTPDEGNGSVQMFATGLGRPVSVNQSSMEKARAFFKNHNSGV